MSKTKKQNPRPTRNKRVAVDRINTQDAIKFVVQQLGHQLKIKGLHTFASSHEILGVIAEEIHELEHAIHDKDRGAWLSRKEHIKNELGDIAVAAIFGIASLDTVDWL